MYKYKILLIEDNRLNAFAIQNVIKGKRNIIVEWVENVDLALKKLNVSVFDLLIIDKVLPDGDGFELASIIKKRELLSSIPIIFMSGEDLQISDIRTGYAIGAIDFIKKPFTEEELLNKINYHYNAYIKEETLIENINDKNSELRKSNDELKIATDTLAQSEKKWEILGKSIPDFVVIINSDNCISFFNKPFVPYITEEQIDKGIDTFIYEKTMSDMAYVRARLIDEDEVNYEIYFEESNQYYKLNFTMLNKSSKEILLVISDISKEKAFKEKIEFLTFHDGLTGLYNRNYFEQYLMQYDFEENLPVSILLADMNSLKLVNDAFGHQKGDKLLHDASIFLKDSLRDKDIVARWGGDEFIALLSNTSDQEAQEIAERISQNIFDVQNDIFAPHFALGAATMDVKNKTYGELILEAENRMYRNKLRDSKSYRSNVVESLKKTLFEKDYETIGHTVRMEKMALRIADELNMTGREKDELSLLASLHDIGKVTISDEILFKNGPLNEREWEIIRRHPETGYNICKTVPELAPIAEAILGHHERWDGKGYPQGLSGEEIPLMSRMISIIDTYDVMTNSRPYKEATTHEKAIEEIKQCAGSQFDQKIVEEFLKVISEIRD